jgi:hypothetical protein
VSTGDAGVPDVGEGEEVEEGAQEGGREKLPARERGRRVPVTGRGGARESQGWKEGARESLHTLPPSLAFPHAPREGGRV